MAFALREGRDKGLFMTSDRMMQAIGRMERAITRLETAMVRGRDHSARQADEIARLQTGLHAAEERNAALLKDVEQAQESAREGVLTHAEQDPHAMNPFSHDKALAALRSLDSLIDDLQKARRDG